MNIHLTSVNQPWRLVVIDDSYEDRAEARRLLLRGSERRCIFTEANTGHSGIAAVQKLPTMPDCVLLDYNLPDMDALEVLAALTGLDGLPVCPVVVLTGSAGPEAGRSLLRAGAQDYIGKDWLTPAGLSRAIENAIERLAMARELLLREAAIRRNEKELQTLADNTPDILARFDSDLRYVFVNVAIEKASGRRRRDFLGKTHRELDTPADLCLLWNNAIQSVFFDGRSVGIDFEYTKPGGTRRFASTRLVPEYGTDSKVDYVLSVTHDVTDRKRHEKTLAEADRRKDEFIAMLAHELRNPLAPIRAGSEVLRRTEDAHTVRKTLDMMDRQLNQITRLVEDLLDVSRITNDKLLLRLERLPVSTVIAAAAEAAAPHMQASGHELVIDLPAQALWLDGDPTRLTQVIGNLLNNAAKYSAHGGRIVLSARLEAHQVAICVTDTGAGIPKHMLGQIFEMFTQVDETIDSAQSGLGIGLALVKRLVGLHNGTVIAESAGSGHGSTFTVRLAAAPAPQPSLQPLLPVDVQEISSIHQAPHRRRILVVDDNKDVANTLALMLDLFGHDTQTAFSGQEALDTSHQFDPEVVFLDIGLPGMNGFEVAKKFRASPKLRHCMLVALTGWGSESDRLRSAEAGFDAHLTKPVEPDAFDELLSRFDEFRNKRNQTGVMTDEATVPG